MKNLIYFIAISLFFVRCNSSYIRVKDHDLFMVTPTDNAPFDTTARKAPYKSLSAFGTDTLAFLKYNFDHRKGYYSNKPLYILLKDLSIPIKSYIPHAINTISYNEGIYIDLLKTAKQSKRLVPKKANAEEHKLRFMSISFTNKSDITEANVKIVTKRGPWNENAKAYYNGKIVDEIALVFY